MLRNHLGFFTRISAGSHAPLDILAGSQHYFPVAGLVIGLLLSLAFGIIEFAGLPPAAGGALLAGFLYLLTGIIHIDGLADFVDALAASGDREDRIEAMQDSVVGAAGALAVTVILLLLYSLFSELLAGGARPVFFLEILGLRDGFLLVPALIAAEVSAKLGMNTALFFSHPIQVSSAEVFMQETGWRTYSLSVAIAGGVLAVLGPVLLVSGLLAQAVPVYLARVSEKNFGGGSGDMVGAANEMTRVTALLLIFLI